MKKSAFSCLLLLFTLAVAAQGADQRQKLGGTNSEARIVREVRHELLLLPWYTVFDDLAYKVNGDTVTLLGQVTRPVLKDDANTVVKGIEGVDKVVNNIQVLPPSPMDWQIRHREFRAIYGFPSLQKYAYSARPSIHIIVNGGHVTLTGVVDNQGDKDVAGIQAKGVPGVFSVQNNLQVQPQ